MITGQDLMALAERWVQQPTEAEWRAALSRAYYAAFHEARALLRSLGFRVPRGDRAHAYLWMRLLNAGDPQVQATGSDLNILRNQRNRADYDIDQAFPQHEAVVQIRTARAIIQTLVSCTADPLRTQITDAMRVYERDILKTVTWQP
jgi:uncharacterized protein (UPF0332 family)